MRYVWLWLALAAFNLLTATARAAAGEWHVALNSLAFAVIDAYVASLLYERQRVRRVLRSVGVRDT